jgi:hypothetical protein
MAVRQSNIIKNNLLLGSLPQLVYHQTSCALTSAHGESFLQIFSLLFQEQQCMCGFVQAGLGGGAPSEGSRKNGKESNIMALSTPFAHGAGRQTLKGIKFLAD